MSLFKHKGGNLPIFDKGTKVSSISYGPGLHKSCPECKVASGSVCVTKSGRTLNKSHSARLT
jgi:hypothetical protein